MYETKPPHNSEKYKPTYILLAVNVAFYIFTSIAGGDFLVTQNSMVFSQLHQFNYAIFFEGAYYQLFTSMFLHANIIHLAVNMISLIVFGLRGEEMFSLPEFLGVYLLGGLAGNVLSLAMGPFFRSVGASGAIFALLGAVIIYDRRINGRSIVGGLMFVFFMFLLSSGENVNYLAHLGGLVGGLLIGYVLAARRKPETRYQVTYSYGRMPF